MRLTTQATLGRELPSKIDLNFGDVLQVFIQDNNGQPLVADSIYLTDRPQSGTYGGSLSPNAPPATFGADPSAIQINGKQVPAANTWPSAYATISASHISYYAPSQANSTGSVKAKLVAVSGGKSRELMLDVN